MVLYETCNISNNNKTMINLVNVMVIFVIELFQIKLDKKKKKKDFVLFVYTSIYLFL